ncbi:MAG: DUF3800 domain-containing protein [Crenarchaeota archaeon]|nr:DUF3800 domain-containing protein [Thermoproteota archaeon]
MYLLFLDASGHSEFAPPYGRGKDTYYVLTGVAIQHQQWFTAFKELHNLCLKYFPKCWAQIEIHYGDLINKRGYWNTLKDEQRKEFADSVFSIIAQLNPTLFAMVIHKTKHFEAYTTPEHPKQLAVRYMASRFSKFLQRRKESGIMIYDSEAVSSDRPLHDFLTKGRFKGLVMQANFDFKPEVMFQTQNNLEGIIESIFFIESKYSQGIQLADFCAYAIWSHFERNNSNRFNQIYPLFDKLGVRNVGLYVWEPSPFRRR